MIMIMITQNMVAAAGFCCAKFQHTTIGAQDRSLPILHYMQHTQSSWHRDSCSLDSVCDFDAECSTNHERYSRGVAFCSTRI
jgi:hypothetical protein